MRETQRQRRYEPHAFLWTEKGRDGRPRHPRRHDSDAYAVNDGPGRRVQQHRRRRENHAFSWTEQGGMVDLGTLGGAPAGASR